MSVPTGFGRRSTFVLVVCVVAFGALAATAYTLWRLRAEAIDRQLETAALTVQAFEEHLTQSLNVIDRTLVNVSEGSRAAADLARALRQAPYLRSIAVLGDGAEEERIAASSEPRNLGVRLARSGFLPLADGPVEVLRSGALLAGRDFHEGTPVGPQNPPLGFIPLARDVRRDDGSWTTVAAAVNPDYFLNFYRNHIDPERGTVELLRYDGRLLLSTDERRRPGQPGGGEALLARLAEAEAGRLEEVLADGRAVLSAYRASRAYPFLLVLRLDKAQGLLGWRREALNTFAIVGLVLLAALALASLYFVRFERVARARERDEERLRTLSRAVEQSPVSIIITDPDGRIQYVNPKFEEVTGYAAGEVLGRNPRLLSSQEKPSGEYRQMWAGLEAGSTWRGEFHNRRKNGELFWEQASISPVFNDAGALQHYVAVKEDITDRKLAEAERKALNRDFVTFLENTSDFIYFKDARGRFRFCSQPLADITHHASWRDMIGKDDREVFPADTAQIYHDEELPIFRDGLPLLNRIDPYCDAAGRPGWVSTSKWPILDDEGKVAGLFGISRDVTQSKRAEIDLRIAAAAFEAQEGMFITDMNSVILRVNRAFTEITGYSAAEAVGQTPRLLRSGRHDAAFYSAMWESIATRGAWQGEIWNRRKSGMVFPEWLTITAVEDSDAAVSHYVCTLTDITQRKDAEYAIEHLAFYDPLTRLPNRRLLLDRLHRALAAAARSEREGALLFIDLDNFKTLNDTFGHDMGDLLLQRVAERLAACVREGDTVARLGGDEFVVLLENLSEKQAEAATQAQTVGEKIRLNLNQGYDLAGHEYHSTPSIGITLFARQASCEDLMKRADLALYGAKAAGRNAVRFFEPEMQAAVSARAQLEKDLRQGLREGQFLLHYQPQVDGLGSVTGAEALVRWQHPALGRVAPGAFIPLAEECGLIVPLGLWVLEAACAQLAAWAQDPQRAHLTVAVNVSARQFRQPDFVAQVLAVLASSGAPPERLKLELTESLLLDDVEESIARMSSLRRRGVSFSLDDFGTGYSSLSYLKRLPLDQLKIDVSFVRDVLTDPNDAAIARTIIALAQSLNLGVIAEGVESAGQRAFLARQGCHAFQGYLFGPPLALADFERHLDGEAAPAVRA